ncbi:MAG: hypothetical protein IT168_33280 [Bryobacterales bacterium]|nr:hypothetical protein [Bryobacterales bacterium]
MAVSQSILERVYAKIETAFGTAATLAAANCMRHTKCSLTAEQAYIQSSDKTGSISATRGRPGARGGRWSLEYEARPNGVAGQKPDCDPILEAAFGQAATVVASTSVTYSLANAIKSFTLGRFRQPSTVMQQVGIGCVLQELGFSFEQAANCKFTANGSSLWVPDSVTFSSLDATGKGGLGAFPPEPASPVTNGEPVNGLAGTATLDGSSQAQIRSASVRMSMAVEIPRDRLFAGQYGSSPERDVLGAYVDLTVVDEDIAAVTGLYSKALSGTPVDIVLEAGSVTGNRFKWTLKNCLLPMPELDDSARKWASNLRGIRAYSTSLTSLDEVSLMVY